MSRHLQALGKILCYISREVLDRTLIPMGNWAHPHQSGDMVWVKDRKKESLQPSCMGPHLVILATPTAVKVTGVTPWIHHSGMKKAAAPADPNDWQALCDPTNLLKLRFQRTSQQHAIARESTSPAPATSQKLIGQRMVKA
jgi:hypothetical protein